MTTFLSPSNSTDLDLENEKPFTKGIFEPLMRIIEPLKKGKDKPLLRIIEPLRRIFDPVVDRVRSMFCKAVCEDMSNKEGTHNFFPKPVGIRSIALDPKNVVIDPVIDTCFIQDASFITELSLCYKNYVHRTDSFFTRYFRFRPHSIYACSDAGNDFDQDQYSVSKKKLLTSGDVE